MMTWAKKYAPDWLTFVSALLIVASFTPWQIYPLIWIALIPWFFALERAGDSKRALAQGVWLSFFMSLGGFYWVARVLQQFGNLNWAIAVSGLLLFSLFNQLQFLLFAPTWKWLRGGFASQPGALAQRGIAGALLTALAYTGLDWAVPKLFVDTLGHSMYVAQHLRQVADLTGATGLTFLIFLVNETLYFAFRSLRERSEPSYWPLLRTTGPSLAVVLILATSAWTYGYKRYTQIVDLEAHPRRTIQAAVIQANIGDFEKVAAEHGISGAADRVITTFFDMSDRALLLTPKPDFIVWPETSYPSTFRTPQTAAESDRDRRVEVYVRARGVPLLFGGYDHFEKKDYNAFFLLSPRPEESLLGGDLQIYRKNVLLLFGEYIPGAEQIQAIKNAFPQVGNFGRGVGPSVHEITTAHGPVKIGPIICYEALFPNYVIAAARKGSQMILNITNDSWFGNYGEPELHLSLTTFRGIETRLPQLRATNTGISTLILPNGEITQPTAVGDTTILNTTIPLIEPVPTLMLAWGDWFGPTALAIGWIGCLALAWVQRKRPLSA